MALTKAKLMELIDNGDIDVGGGGGQNILHNWDFRNPVNQRGVSGAISTGAYFYDRWIRNNGTVTTNAAYLTVGAAAVIEQRIEGLYLAGETVTVSVKVGTSYISGSGTFPTSAGTASITLAGFGTATLGYNAGYMYVRFTATGATRNLAACKLELGTVSTLAYDPPMDYGVELAKCQRYFYAVANTYLMRASVISLNGLYFNLHLPCEMRTSAPTATLGSFEIYNMANTLLAGFTLSSCIVRSTVLLITMIKPGHGVTDALGYVGATSLTLSADL